MLRFSISLNCHEKDVIGEISDRTGGKVERI